MFSTTQRFLIVAALIITILVFSIDDSVSAGNADSNTNAIKSFEATVDKRLKELIAVIKNVTSHDNHIDKPGSSRASCRDIYLNHKSQGNKAYILQMDVGNIPVYCHMTRYGLGTCGGGGWTLVMKIDGHKPTFHYSSKLWSNKIDFNLPGGKTGLDVHETKLPSYWNTPLSKICLVMKVGHQIHSLVISQNARSLFSLIADGQYRSTSLGRDTWKKLIGPQASLQPNCNKEGFNTAGYSSTNSRARIGIIGDDGQCRNCDSRIGFGTGGYPTNSNTCGNVAKHGADNGDKSIKAMGYILVQ